MAIDQSLNAGQELSIWGQCLPYLLLDPNVTRKSTGFIGYKEEEAKNLPKKCTKRLIGDVLLHRHIRGRQGTDK
jgi:hypothetical protein